MPRITWFVEVADFLKLRITAILSGALLFGAFYEATFVKPSLIERSLLILSAMILGWYFCRKFYEVEIQKGEMYDFRQTEQLSRPTSEKQQLNG